jgi:signal transduction histidine kinase
MTYYNNAVTYITYSLVRIYNNIAWKVRSIFELLWNERAANEELRKAHEMQKEFINIASHEMKTPTQAILGFTELVETHPDKSGEMILETSFRFRKLKLAADLVTILAVF